MAGRLEGKVVLLTGAGGGLGSAQSRLMAKEGAALMLANLPEDPIIAEGRPPSGLWDHAQSVAADIRDAGVKRT